MKGIKRTKFITDIQMGILAKFPQNRIKVIKSEELANCNELNHQREQQISCF